MQRGAPEAVREEVAVLLGTVTHWQSEAMMELELQVDSERKCQ